MPSLKTLVLAMLLGGAVLTSSSQAAGTTAPAGAIATKASADAARNFAPLRADTLRASVRMLRTIGSNADLGIYSPGCSEGPGV